MNILIQETYLNEDDNCIIGDSGVYESSFSKKSDLFRYCQKEFGRCCGFIRVDINKNESIKIGWTFLKRAKYTDCNEYYLQETWIVLHNNFPVQSFNYDYKSI